MIIKRNFSEELTPRLIDEIYYDCNFSAKFPDEKDGKKIGKRLFPDDDTPRTFINCNLSNRIIPPGSTYADCNRTIAEVGIEVAREKIDEVVVNEKTMEVFNLTVEHRIYGRYDENEKPVYRPTPIVKQYNIETKEEKEAAK